MITDNTGFNGNGDILALSVCSPGFGSYVIQDMLTAITNKTSMV